MTGHRSRTCSVLSTGDVLGSAALAAATLLPDVAAAAALATKEVAVYRVMMLGGPGVGKTALTQQFVTSEYIAAQNTSFGRSTGVASLKPYFHSGCALRCVAREIETLSASLYLSPRNATHSRNGNKPLH